MKIIKVNLGERGYDIVIGRDIITSFGRLLKKINCGNNAVVVTNPIIRKIWGKKISGPLKQSGINVIFEEIADTEKSKSMTAFSGLLNKIAGVGRSRKIFIIAFGGGVVGDLAGFTASAYKRGTPCIQLPTTLLAQVDSSIGGKTAIDLKVGKNLAGAFYQPRLVFSETLFLSTLPKREVINGLSEVVKCAVIKDAALFKFLENHLDKILRLEKGHIEHIIAASCRIKARIIERDEFDKTGIRAVLNYGHTIGHAVETAGGYSKRYTHGEAISIGMIAANRISEELGLISSAASKRIQILLEKIGLPIRARGINAGKVYTAHLYDKKFTGGKNRFVLPLAIGRTRLTEGVPERLIRKTINSICNQE